MPLVFKALEFGDPLVFSLAPQQLEGPLLQTPCIPNMLHAFPLEGCCRGFFGLAVSASSIIFRVDELATAVRGFKV